MNVLSNLRHWLFDFSAGQEEGKRIGLMFRVALAEISSETEFLSLCYPMLQEDDYLKTQVRWINVMRQLDQFRSVGNSDRRVAAKHLIAYLPRYYGYESVRDVEPERPSTY